MEKAHKQKQEQQLAAAAAAASQNAEQSTSQPELSKEPQNDTSEDQPNDQDDSSVDNTVDQEDDETESEDDEALYENLVGKKVNEEGQVIDKKTGVILGKLVDGKLKRVIGKRVRENGTLVSSKGKIIGHVEPITPEDSEESEGSEDDTEEEDEQLEDDTKNENTVSDLQEKSPNREIESDMIKSNDNDIVQDGLAQDHLDTDPENGDQKYSSVDENSPQVRKSGKVLDKDDNLVGHVDPRVASKLAGLKVDDDGNVINKDGHIVGKADMIKLEEPKEEEEEQGDKPFNPNPQIHPDSPEVRKSGKVLDKDDNIVGHLDAELAIKYVGLKVDPEGNVVNAEGNLVAKANMIQQEDPAQQPYNPNPMITEDSPEVRKSGKVVDAEDNIVGHVDKRIAAKLAGLKVDEEGNVVDHEGRYVGKADMIKPEQPKEEENKQFNPNQMIDENSPEVKKSGKILDSDDNIVGNIDKRMAHKLAGFKVDPDGNIINNEGHIVGKADMIKEEEEEEPTEESPKYPNPIVDDNSPEVKRSGKVVDIDDEVVGNVDSRDAPNWVGFKVSTDGSVIDTNGNMVGKAEMIKEKTEEERSQEAEDDEYRRIADNMSQAIQHSLDKIKPVLKQITDNIDAEEAKSPDDRDEKKLVETVKPLIEQASGILNEANGAIRGLDPSGQIAKKAQARTNERKALPEEYHLADLLAQLSGEVSTTIDRAKKKIKNMPHAKKALSPLWNILQSPLLQILSAVGLLLTGVLGLVGNILNGLGLGGIINSLLGGIGLNKVLEGFGLGDALKLGGKKN
ncbi:hypothetical protein K501DRAFT_331303 [Backusella circina FSU 941]|nr:hypothetical protein K501DRAFT_331303 [Backusella circina FSU 941]